MNSIPDDYEGQEAIYLHTLGLIIQSWAEFEAALFVLLAQLLHVDEFRARTVWHSMPNLSARRKLIERLGDTYISDKQLPAFRSLMRRIKKIGHNRNVLAHSLGGIDYKRKKVGFVADRDDGENGMDFIGHIEFDLTNVVNWPNDIFNLQKDVLDFANVNLHGQLYASPKMHRERPAHHAGTNDPVPPDTTPSKPEPPPQSSQA
ncbi:MAG: hypothetical protein ACKVP5_10045 [Aestuariivirga sp.]